MGVPPPSRSGGGLPTQPSEEGPSGEPKRRFAMPDSSRRTQQQDERGQQGQDRRVQDRRESTGQKKDEPKEGGGGQQKTQEVKTPIEKQTEAEALKELSSVEARNSVAKIGEIIQKLVEKMQVGTVGGKSIISMDLKASAEIPSVFANASLTITQTADGLIIKFGNLVDEKAAVALVEQNKDQLSAMLQALQARNITVADFLIGNTSVTMPGIERVTPLQFGTPTPTPESFPQRGDQGEQQRERRDREEDEEPGA